MEKLSGKEERYCKCSLSQRSTVSGGISAPTPLQHFILPFHFSLVKVIFTGKVSLESTLKSPFADGGMG